MIKITTTKQYGLDIAKAFETGVDQGNTQVVECVINALLDTYDGSESAFMTLIAETITRLVTNGYMSMEDGMDVTNRCAMISNEMPKAKKSKKVNKVKGKKK